MAKWRYLGSSHDLFCLREGKRGGDRNISYRKHISDYKINHLERQEAENVALLPSSCYDLWSHIGRCPILVILSRYHTLFLRFYAQLQHKSSPPEVFFYKGILRNFAKFSGKHLCLGLSFDKIPGLRPATLLKERLWHRCFLVNFEKFLRTPFFTEHLWWLLLFKIIMSVESTSKR